MYNNNVYIYKYLIIMNYYILSLSWDEFSSSYFNI